MLSLIIKNQNKLLFNFLFLILLLVLSVHFYQSFFSMLGNKWTFWELFVNYAGGFMKRGILGEIFINLNRSFGISPFSFFSPLFVFLYSLQIIIFYKLIYPYKISKLLCALIVFSPALLLFNFYDINTYFTKDNFTKVAILIHALFIVKKVHDKNSIANYNRFLNFLIIPLLLFNILNHEHQVFFVSVHMLLTLLVNYNYGGIKSFTSLKSYLILLIPFLFILLTPNSFEKVGLINDSIRVFGTKISDLHAGNINLMIGQVIKWHFLKMPFYDHNVFDFLNLFTCMLLSLFLFYLIFHYFIKQNIYEMHEFIKKYYLLFFLPCFGLFITALDHGRTINIFLTHLISFYLALKINNNKFKIVLSNFNKSFFLKNLSFIFLIFYVFLWYIPVGGGYDAIGTFSEGDAIFKSTLMSELINLFMIVYNFVDYNIINLPRIVV